MTDKASLYQRAADLYKQAVANGADEAVARQKYDAAIARITAMGEPSPAAAPAEDAYSRPGSLGRTATGLLGKFAQGVSLGMADEAAGALLGAIPGVARGHTFKERREEATRIVRGILGDAQRDAPLTSTLTELVGGVAPALVTGGITAEAPVMAGAKAALKRYGRNVAVGAGSGAVSGAGNAEGGLAERARGAATGALFGGAVGAALPLVVGAGKAVAKPVIGAVRGSINDAVAMLADDVERAGLAPDALASTGTHVTDKPLAIVDKLGDVGRRRARGARVLSSEASQVLDDFAKQRNAGAAERVMGDVREGLGIGGTTTKQMARGLDDARAVIGATEFTPDRMAQAIENPDFANLLTSSPVFRKAHQAFRAAAKLDPTAEVPPALFGREGLTRAPTVRDVENIRQGLQDILESGGYATRTTTGGPAIKALSKAQKRAVKAAQRAMLDDPGLTEAAPWYAPARARLATKHREGAALLEGAKMRKAPVADVADALADQSAPEQAMSRMGLANAIEQQVSEAPGIAASRLAGGAGSIPARLKRLTTAAASPDAAQRMTARLGAEDQMAETARQIMGGSNTADKAADVAGIAARVLQALKGGGGIVKAGRELLADVGEGNVRKTAGKLARMYGETDPTRQREIADLVAAALANKPLRYGRQAALTSVASQQIGAASQR